MINDLVPGVSGPQYDADEARDAVLMPSASTILMVRALQRSSAPRSISSMTGSTPAVSVGIS